MSESQNPLREIFQELEPLFERQGNKRQWQYSRRDKFLMRSSLYSCLVGVTLAFVNAFWHFGWIGYVVQTSIVVCWLSGCILMISGMVGGVRAIRKFPLTVLHELGESSDLEYAIITKLRDKDDFLLSCVEEKIKSRSQEVEGRGNLVPSFLEKYKVLLPILAVALAGAGVLQQLVSAAFGVDPAQAVAMLLVGFFVGQFFSRGHVATLNRAIFVLRQAREAKKSSHDFPRLSSDTKIQAALPHSAQAVEPVSASLN